MIKVEPIPIPIPIRRGRTLKCARAEPGDVSGSDADGTGTDAGAGAGRDAGADAEVAVVGGGVAGCAVARALAPAYDVAVFEAGRVAGGATALAAGEVTMVSSYPDEPSIGRHAVDFFRAYDGTGGFEFAERPSLGLVTPERAGAARRRARRLADERGLPVTFRDAAAAAERHPRFDFDGLAGVVEHGDQGFLDPYTLAVTLKADAEARGARFHTDTPVEAVATGAGAVAGVETPDGRHAADSVVAAAGWRTRRLLADVLPLPIRPYRTQIVILEPDEPLPAGFPMGWYPGEHVYFRGERNGDLLVGGWSLAEDDPEAASGDADEAFRSHVAGLVPRFLRGFDGAGVVDGRAGVDAATPDTRPIIDAPAEGPDGLVVASGFHGRGVMTAPVTGTAVRALIDAGGDRAGADAPFPLAPFALDRFETRGTDFEFHSISADD